MKAPRSLLLHALAALGLGVLGWDALQPRPAPNPSRRPPIPSESIPKRESFPTPESPVLIHLFADRILHPGQRFSVHGRLLTAPDTPPPELSLEGPDGTSVSAQPRPAVPGEGPFSLEHPTTAARPGFFTWKLRLSRTAPPMALGVQVVEPERPRVLVLQDHPGVEGFRLQRWLAAVGSPVSARTRVSAEHFRISSGPGAPEALPSLDAPTLARFDTLVAHPAALERLTSEERGALEIAIREDGLGLLIFGPSEVSPRPSIERPPVADETTSSAPNSGVSGVGVPVVPIPPVTSPALPPSTRPLNPWDLVSEPETGQVDASRVTRLRLADGRTVDSGVTVIARSLAGPSSIHALARDSQGRILAGRLPLGRGFLARTLVIDSWRLHQRGATNDYAHYWSFLLSHVSRHASPVAGAWAFEDPSTPSAVDQPIRLIWLGSAHAALPDADVSALEPSTPRPTRLALYRDPSEPSRAHAVFWPSHPGWHRVRALPDGPSLSFFVQPPETLAGIRSRDRRDAEPRDALASTSAVTGEVPGETGRRLPSAPASIAFLLVVLSAAMLWIDARR